MLVSTYNVSPKCWRTFHDLWPRNGWDLFAYCYPPFGGHYAATIKVATCLIYTLLVCIACTQCIRCGLLLQMSHVAWSVCLSVCQSHGCTVQKTAEMIEMPLWGMTLEGPRNDGLDGVESPHKQGKFCRVVLKSTASLCCGVRSKRDHSLLTNGTTVRLLQLGATLHYPCEKSARPWWSRSSKILWLLVYFRSPQNLIDLLLVPKPISPQNFRKVTVWHSANSVGCINKVPYDEPG